jgi:ribosomal protein S18 acetylase RimI-like enzyme
METPCISIAHAETDEDIEATFSVMHQLRPDLQKVSYLARIRALMRSDGLRIVVLRKDDAIVGVATYRLLDMLYCGRILIIDDLVVDENARSHGYGNLLLRQMKAEGMKHDCREVQLISRVTREAAHRFYFREGFGMECFHFRVRLDERALG